MCFLDSVYKTFVISTIVDIEKQRWHSVKVYKTFVIWLIGKNIVPLHYKFLSNLQ